MKKELIEPFFATLRAANPLPASELEFTAPFELLVAVLLSAQATDVGVNKATRKLFPVANTPQAILDLGPERLEDYIKTIGLYRAKARHLMATCRILVDRYGGEVPRTREELESLPGVGRKTAACIQIFSWGIPEIPVDVHVHRVGGRLGLFRPNASFEEAHDEMLAITDGDDAYELHMNLIRHGRMVCRPQPRCQECALRRLCPWWRENRAPGSGAAEGGSGARSTARKAGAGR